MEVERVDDDNSSEIENMDATKTAVVDLKGLSTRTLNVLEKNKVTSVEDIMNLTEVQISELDGMGEKGIKEIKKAIGDFGINLKKEN
jgi:DNA-directed RNA polymerase alpha subunit